MEAIGHVVRDQTGQAVRLLGINLDVTCRRQAKEQSDLLHAAVELAMEGISKLDETGRYVFVNRQYAVLLGYQPEELIGQSWEITVHPDDRLPVMDAFKQMLAMGRAEAELRGIRKDGSMIYKHVVIVKPDSQGEHAAGHYCFAKDITERKRAELDRAESQRLLAAITRIQSLFIDDQTAEAVWEVLLEELLQLTQSEYGFIGEIVHSAEGQPVLRSQAITNIAWNDESRPLLTSFAPNLEFRHLKTLFGHVMTTGKPVIANDPANDPRTGGLPPGHPPMHALLGLPYLRGETLTGMVGIANRPGGYDDRLVEYLQPFLATCAQLLEGYRSKRLKQEAEEALRVSEERWQLAAKGTNDGIWDWDLVNHRVFYSARWAEMRGFQHDELTDSEDEWRTRIHPDDLSRVLERLHAYLDRRSPEFSEEYRTLRKDGSFMWILDRGVTIWDEQGRPVRMAGSDKDITERKREEMFQAAEKQALEMVAKGESLQDVLTLICKMIELHAVPMRCAVMLVSEDGQHLTSGAAPSLPEGYSRDVDGIPIGPTVGPCGCAAYFGRATIVEDITKDPLWKDHASVALQYGLRACWSQPIFGSSGTVLGIFAAYYSEPRSPQPSELDVMERAGRLASLAIEHDRVSEALRASEARFQAFMDHGTAVTFIKDETGRHLYINPKFESLFGVSKAAIKDKTVFDFMPTEIAARLYENDQSVLATGRALETEEPVPTPDGKVKHWLVIKFPINLGQKRLLGGVAVDITARKQMEESLWESERRFRLLADTAPALIWMAGIDKRCTYFNARWLEYTGRTIEQELGDGWVQGVHQDDRDRCLTIYSEAFDRHDAFGMEYRLRKADGSYGWLQDNGEPRFLPDGTFAGYLGACIDITERKQAEAHLRRTQFAMDQAVDAVYWIDPQARILYTNEAASVMLGYTADEFLRMTVHDLNPNFPPEVWPAFWAETREKKVVSLETVHLAKDGQRIPIDIRVTFLAHGAQEFHCAFVRDISERKQSEQALCESQERFELAAHATNDGIWDWNILTGEQYWSDRHLELFELEPGVCIPTYDMWISLVHPDDVDRVRQATRRHLDIRDPYDIEVRVRMKDGRYRWFRDRGQAVWDAQGRPVRMVGSISDITERRNAEEALRMAHSELERRVTQRTAQLMAANESLEREIADRKRIEARLQTTQYAVDQAADQIFVIGPDGRFLDVNESACRRLGYSKEELLTMSVMDIDPDFPSTMWASFWSEFHKAKRIRLETRHRSKTGEIYPVEVAANYLWHDGQEFDYAIVRDISERKRAEEAVRDSEARYKLLTDATFDGIAIHDQGVLLEVNPGLEKMFGYAPGELIGRSMWELIAEESRDRVMNNMRDGVDGPYEAVGRRKDGTTFPGEVVVRPYHYRGKNVRLVAGRDITARKWLEAELTRHTEELERQVAERTAKISELMELRAKTEKLAAMGQLAAGVAHEINNPIAGIRNAFQLVKQAVDPSHPSHEFVGMIDREISRVAGIVQNMYLLYKKQESRTVDPVHLPVMFRDLQELLAKPLGQRNLSLTIDVQSSVGTRLFVSRSDLFQVLLNFVQNAIDSSRPGGTISLNVEHTVDGVRIAVSDDGAGIAPEVLPHIFDPFFTTKTDAGQKGMGLGLAISQSLVMAMGGKIEVQTEVDRGSTFSILLPRMVADAQPPIHKNKEVFTHDD